MRTRKGTAFIVTLGVLTALVLILTAAVRSQRQGMRATANRMDQQLAEVAAQAGLQRAIATLSTQVQSPTKPSDEWATLGGTKGDEATTVGQGQFRVEIVDSASLVNLNTAPQEQLLNLQLTQEQVDCILDWREQARTSNRADGAKDTYYNNLPNGYNAKLLPFETVDELLQVKGFTPKELFEPRTNVISSTAPLPTDENGNALALSDLLTVDSTSSATSAAGAALQDLRTATAPAIQRAVNNPQLATQIFQRRTTFTSMQQVLATPGFTTPTAKAFVNAFRVGNANETGRINLNTAPQAVLQTVPNLTLDLVNAIVSRQSSGFTQLGDLFDVPGYTVQVAQRTIDRFAINSTTFEIRVIGMPSQMDQTTSNSALSTTHRAKVALKAIVRISQNQPPRILRIEQPPQPDVETKHWGWQADPTTTTPIEGSSL